jgi:hypothetical protein
MFGTCTLCFKIESITCLGYRTERKSGHRDVFILHLGSLIRWPAGAIVIGKCMIHVVERFGTRSVPNLHLNDDVLEINSQSYVINASTSTPSVTRISRTELPFQFVFTVYYFLRFIFINLILSRYKYISQTRLDS